MLRVCRSKLAAHETLREQLLGTGDAPIVGGPSTEWHGAHRVWDSHLLEEQPRHLAKWAPARCITPENNIWCRCAEEPILPMSLFANNTFLVVNFVGLMVGMAMFGTITFLPFFLQVVKGVSPTSSGLFLVPMMGGLILASTVAGRIMSKTGRYRLLPIASQSLGEGGGAPPVGRALRVGRGGRRLGA